MNIFIAHAQIPDRQIEVVIGSMKNRALIIVLAYLCGCETPPLTGETSDNNTGVTETTLQALYYAATSSITSVSEPQCDWNQLAISDDGSWVAGASTSSSYHRTQYRPHDIHLCPTPLTGSDDCQSLRLTAPIVGVYATGDSTFHVALGDGTVWELEPAQASTADPFVHRLADSGSWFSAESEQFVPVTVTDGLATISNH